MVTENHPPLSEVVAANARSLMAWQKKNGTGLARALSCSQQSASRRLTGAQPFTLDELPVLASWLGVEVTTLLRPVRAEAGVA